MGFNGSWNLIYDVDSLVICLQFAKCKLWHEMAHLTRNDLAIEK